MISSSQDETIDLAIAQLQQYKASKRLKDILKAHSFVSDLLATYIPEDDVTESPSINMKSPYESELFPSYECVASAPIDIPSTPSSVSGIKFSFDGNDYKLKNRHIN